VNPRLLWKVYEEGKRGMQDFFGEAEMKRGGKGMIT